MKKIIAFAMVLCMIFSCFSCAFLEDSNDEESASSSSKSPSSSSADSSSEQGSSSEESSSSKESSSSEEAPSSSSSSEEISSSDEVSSSEDIAIPVITEYGEFSSAITKTTPSTDRLRQGSQSRNAYNAGSSYSQSKLNSVLSNATLIKNVGSLLGYTNASGFIDHFLQNTGENYTIDMSKLLTDTNALGNRNASLSNALRACEMLAVKGETINVFQKSEVVHHNLTGDWRFSLGSYFSSIEIQNLSFDGSKYRATFIYKVTDYYNWDPSDSNSVFSGAAGALTGNISPKDLHHLHRAGMAKEFLSVGQVSYTVEWSRGDSVLDVFK